MVHCLGFTVQQFLQKWDDFRKLPVNDQSSLKSIYFPVTCGPEVSWVYQFFIVKLLMQ